jgi:6-phosphogluconolactonase (cycloisomerase 2 family)
MTVEISQSSGLEFRQIRVVEGKEPLEFATLFSGNHVCIVDDDLNENEWRIFDIRKNEGNLVKAIQCRKSGI